MKNFKKMNWNKRIYCTLIFLVACAPAANFNNPTDGSGGVLMELLRRISSTITNTTNSESALKVVLTGNPSAITEGQTATVQIKMSKAITSSLTVTLTLDNTAITIDGASSKEITFTPDTATTNQSFTLAAIVDTNTISETVNLKISASGIEDQTLTISALDTTTSAPVISISNVPTSITEGNTVSGIGIKLSGNVNQNYTVTITSSNTTSITASSTSLTFTPNNFTVDQSISLQALHDANLVSESVTFTLSATGLNPVTFTVTATDDDTQNISLTSTVTGLNEGASGEISVSLTQEPAANVTVSLSSSDTTSLTLGVVSLTFTPTNYSTPQTVTVTSLQDVNQTSETVVVTATSMGLTTKTWNIICVEDDTTIIFAGGNSVTEGSTLTVSITLSGDPGTIRIVNFSSSNTSSATVSPSAMTFNSGNYNTPQTLTVTGVEEANVISESITISASSTGLVSSTKTVTTVDNDTMNITLGGATTVNEGSTATMTVVLTKDPSGSFTVNLSSGDTTSVSVPASVTFTSANYSIPQNVTITGVEDANQTSETVIITASANGVANQTIGISTVENDTTISFGTVAGYEGSTVTVPITLSGNPGQSRTVNFSSSSTPPTFSPSSMTFTTSNYNTPQNLILTGLLDSNTNTVITASDSDIVSITKLVTNTKTVTNAMYTIGGTISGLTGTLEMQNKSLETLSVSANGGYAFTKLSSTYSVVLKTYLLGKICTISNRLGTALASVTNININCSDISYTAGGSALGLVNTGQTTVYATGDDGAHQKTMARTYTDNGDGTVTENVTGLVWQKCSNGLNAITCSGTATNLNWTSAGTYCTGLSLASKAWRLPTIQELASLVDASKSSNTIDATAFPNTQSSYYWSSTTSAPTTSNAWFVYFINGALSVSFKTNLFFVRCVSGTVSGASSFTDNGDGTVTDLATKLVWQKCSNGQNATTCTGTGTTVTWANAITYCTGLSLASKTWRLPNRNELQSIVDYTRGSPAIEPSVFPSTQSDNYLSSTTYAPDTTDACNVFFDNGSFKFLSKTSNNYVRCVSGP